MVQSSSQDVLSLSLPQKIVSAGLAGITADLCTFPLDTVKVWLQVRGETPATPNFSGTKPPPDNGTTTLKTTSHVQSQLNADRLKSAPLKNKNVPMKQMSRFSNVSDKSRQTLSQPNHLPNYGKDMIQKHAGISRPRVIARPLQQPKQTSNFAQLKKSRFQPRKSVRAVSGSLGMLAPSNPGLVGTVVSNVKARGFWSLYGGISAGLQRQAAFCAVRIGLYDNVRAFYQDLFASSHDGKHVGVRILAGTTTALIAVGLFQPTEVVKIRMQAQALKHPQARIYSNSFQAYRAIFNDGIREAWKGLETNGARLGVVNVCELVTYDVVKETILDYRLMKDNPACHFTSAFISGFITTVVASPIDVVKTRYMNSKVGHYKGPVDCAKNMFLGEGFRAFYKGFVPAYLRLGSWNIVMFVSLEQYKRLFHHYNDHSERKKEKKYLPGHQSTTE